MKPLYFMPTTGPTQRWSCWGENWTTLRETRKLLATFDRLLTVFEGILIQSTYDTLLAEAEEMRGNSGWQMAVHHIIWKVLNENSVHSVIQLGWICLDNWPTPMSIKHISDLVLEESAADACDPLKSLVGQNRELMCPLPPELMLKRMWPERWTQSLLSGLPGIALPALSVEAHCGKKAIN